MPYSGDLPLDERKIKRCRQIAKTIADDIVDLVHENSTVGTERAVLRLLGFNDALEHDGLLYPIANLMVDQLKAAGKLESGALYWVANALLESGTVSELMGRIQSRKLNLAEVKEEPRANVVPFARTLAKTAYSNLVKFRNGRKSLLKVAKDPLKEKRPLKYVIVATGNIFEDVTQARSAALDGADIIAVIRSTAQSLLDYVPHGTTTTGFGGTYATQANFHLMRKALDEVGAEQKRYIRLTNYCSGLCMSEIAALAGLEGLDCLLNDAMYGILFRDINMRRTLIDQHFSRLICAVSGIWIMTGEDNYMKTTDAVKESDQVLASQFINEATALNAGMPKSQMAIGHAMEMNPDYERVILMELARAKMTRQIFPEAPLKYMCPTKYMTGDIFTGHAYNVIFDLIGSLTDQGTLLLGMPTEAIHTPFLSDRSLSLRAANYILKGTLGGGKEIGYRTDGFMAKFSNQVLGEALELLEKISKQGLLKSIEKRYFAGVCRLVTSGKGADGVFAIDRTHYLNPFFELMGSKI